MSKRSELGKGIRALLNNADQAVTTAEKDVLVKELSNTIAIIDVASIEVNPYQPRTEFDPEALDELAESIRLHGLIQPITVRHMGDRKYQIISGERRWRASQIAGLTELPAYIRLADDQGMIEMALIENIQRQDLNPLEIAMSYQRLMEECTITHEEVADRVSKKRSTVSNYLRLLKLPPTIQQALRDEVINMGHARVIAGIDQVDRQLLLLDRIIANKMSVRQTEAWAKKQNEPKKPAKPSEPTFDPEVTRIQDEITSILGMGVQLTANKQGRGQLTIRFGDLDQLQLILDHLRSEA